MAVLALTMTPTPLLKTLGWVIVVLVAWSVVGYTLKRWVAGHQFHATIDNLNSRVKTWWVMVFVVGGALVLGKLAILVLFGFISFFAFREFVSLAYTRRGDHWALAVSFFIISPLQYVLIGREKYGVYSVAIPVYAFLLLPMLAAFSADATRFFERAAKVQYALMICVYCVSYVPALLSLRIEGYEGLNVMLIAWLVLTVQSSDVLQYVWSEMWGRIPIAPRLAPSKTVGGFLGGIGSASLVGAAMHKITPFTPLQAGLIALLVCVMGFCGGLVMSAMKRDAGVKDWGTLVEGHGGMLDRLDSVIFAAPVYFHAIRYWWT